MQKNHATQSNITYEQELSGNQVEKGFFFNLTKDVHKSHAATVTVHVTGGTFFP